MLEKSKVLRTCIYVALICYFVIKVCESVDKFQKGKIEEVIIYAFINSYLLKHNMFSVECKCYIVPISHSLP